MIEQPFLSIIIPCYNERQNLQRGVLEEVFAFLKTVTFSWELIVSDDGSTDGSKEIIREKIAGRSDAILLENEHGGKPAAIYNAVKVIRGEYLLFTDMDQSTPLYELNKLLPFFNQYEVIIGSRIHHKNSPLYRQLGSKVFKMIRKSVLLKNIDDSQCGFKVFRTKLAAEIFPRIQFFQKHATIKGWKVTSFDVELLHLAELKGKQIKEVPVEWEDRDVSTYKRKSYLKESREMLLEVMKVKLNDLLGKYND